MPPSREPLPTVASDALLLTFDDGPDPTWTPLVLDALARAGGRATFFLLGEAVRRHPGPVERILADGHEVGLHGDRHVRHDDLAPDELARDTDAALRTLAAHGADVRWWRAPWGVVTPATLAVAAARGLEPVGWHADTHDWRGDPVDRMLAVVRRDAATGGVVLAHDGLGPGARRTGAGETVALVDAVAAWARADGLALETLSAAAAPAVTTSDAGAHDARTVPPTPATVADGTVPPTGVAR